MACSRIASAGNQKGKQSKRCGSRREAKKSWFSKLRTALFSPCANVKDVIEPKGKKGRAKVAPISTVENSTSTKEIIRTTGPEDAIPSTPHSTKDTSYHTIDNTTNSPTMQHGEGQGDLDSVISLGEARELAQLRMDGIAVAPSESEETARLEVQVLCGADTLRRRSGAVPPIDSVYQRKAASALKSAVENGDKVPASSSAKPSGKKSKKSKKRKPNGLLKRSTKMERLSSWIEGSMQSLSHSISKRRQKMKDPNGKIAQEHAKIAELYKKIGEIREELRDVKRHIAYIVQQMEQRRINLFPEMQSAVADMQSLEEQLRIRLDEVRAQESRIKRIEESSSESVQKRSPMFGDCSSDSDESSDEEEVKRVRKPVPPPVPIVVKPYQAPAPVKKSSLFSFRPKTATKRPQSAVKKEPKQKLEMPQTRIIYVAEAKPQ